MDGFSHANQMLLSLIGELRGAALGGVGWFFLAFVFMISAAIKLRQPQPASESIHRFGFGRRPHTTFGFLLGVVEAALAALLASFVWFAPWLAAVILWFFAILIARSLLAGQHFACNCFGSSDADMSWVTFTRTAGLAVLASLLIVMGNTNASTLPYQDRLAQAIIAAAVLAMLVLLARTSHLVHLSRTSVRKLEESPA
jgi:hypothetical protein